MKMHAQTMKSSTTELVSLTHTNGRHKACHVARIVVLVYSSPCINSTIINLLLRHGKNVPGLYTKQ